MQTYNRIMLYFWLIVAALIFVAITYLSLTDGWKKWAFYYIFVVTSLGMFFFKKWMMKRMENHIAFMEEQQKNNERSAKS